MRTFVQAISGATVLFSVWPAGRDPIPAGRREPLQAGMSVKIFHFGCFSRKKGCAFFEQGVTPDAVSGERQGRNLWAARRMAKGRKVWQSVS